MYRYALRPRWILSHLFAIFVVVLFVNLGFWQLRRHDERAERNATVAARSDLPPAPVTDLLAATDDPDDLRFRSATGEGMWGDRDLLVDNRSLNGLPGMWVLRSLALDSGEVLVVNRGFRFAGDDGQPPPPSSRVAVVGKLVPWHGSCGARREGGVPVGMACLDRSTAEEAFGAEVLPVVLERTSSDPPAPDALTPVPLPEPSAGPHRSYAAQWFIFAALVSVVYGLILRKVARERAIDDVAHDAPVTGTDDVTGVTRR